MKLSDPVAQRITEAGVVAVLVIDREEDAVPVARALLNGGVDVMELTLRTTAAIGALRAIRAEVPEMLAGIGTVLTTDQIGQVADAGGAFAVSPGLNREVVLAASGAGLPFAPGVMTPTDIDGAVALGCEVLKFFPAGSSGGLPHLKNIAAPYAHLGLGFVPLGGVNAGNMGEYLGSDLVAAVGGSWLAPRELIGAGDWGEITRRAAEATEIRKASLRPPGPA